MSDGAEFYYNVATGEVEQGHQSNSDNLMGPYATYGEAQAALTTARAKTDRWDAEDRDWNNR